MSLREEIIKSLEESRNVILNGGVNCIPSKFTRFRNEFPGIRRKCYYGVTGGTKASKTQFTTFMFIITPVFYYLDHPDIIKPTIMYFPLEETKEDITLRIYSYIIGHLTNWKVLISPENLESIDERKPIPQNALDIMNSKEFIRIADAFEECIVWSEERNPTGIYKAIKNYLREHGKEVFDEVKVTYTDDFGNTVNDTVKKFKDYIPDNPNEYVIPIVDHAGLLQEERGMTLKTTIEKMSEYFVILRNRYKISPVMCQQQNFETTNLEAFKSNKIRPTKDGLKDSKRPGEDQNVLLGITNPSAYELQEYLGYNVARMRDSFRVLEVVLNRKGRANGLCPLYFNGAINQYIELPLPNDPSIEKMYKYAEEVRQESRKIPSVLMFMKSFITKVINKNDTKRKE